MKKLILIIPLFLLCLSFTSCTKDPKETCATDNSNFKLDLLFEKDGCKMYRFEDAGRYIYWSTCDGKVQQSYLESNGKVTNEIHQETITSSIK